MNYIAYILPTLLFALVLCCGILLGSKTCSAAIKVVIVDGGITTERQISTAHYKDNVLYISLTPDTVFKNGFDGGRNAKTLNKKN